MKLGDHEVLLCNCGGSMRIDGARLAVAAAATGLEQAAERITIHNSLCRSRPESVLAQLGPGSRCLIACTQEIARFEKIAALGEASQGLDFVNIRETAAWTTASGDVSPKILALLTAATVDRAPERQIALTSAGRTLVLGAGQAALDAAQRLAGRLDVTLVLQAADDIVLPAERSFGIHVAQAPRSTGAIGRFTTHFTSIAEVLPWSRARAELSPVTAAAIASDLILDLSDRPPLFPDHQRRLGYIKADARHEAQVARALFDISGLVGELAKPRYVDHDAATCVHTTASGTNCTRCLDACPTGAITSNIGVITVDAAICAGCGSCASLCPTGAMAYIAPPMPDLRRVLAVLLATYTAAGGERAVLLFHSTAKGEQAIAALARYGEGLPANVLPFALRRPTSVGRDLMTLALALGAERVVVQVDPEHEIEADALYTQAALANLLLGHEEPREDRIQVLCTSDPEAIRAAIDATGPVAATLAGGSPPPLDARANELVRECVSRVRPASALDVIALPRGALFGGLVISDACTACLACARVCPTDALIGDARRGRLDFLEANCVQCGACATTCPERAVTLVPRLSFAETAAEPQLLKQAEPAMCPACGLQFGSRRTIEGVIARLAASGWSAQNAEVVERLRLCETCRVTISSR